MTELARILCLGWTLQAAGVKNAEFGSNQSFLDHDILVIDLEQWFTSKFGSRTAAKSVHSEAARNYIQVISRGLAHLKEFMALGRPVLIFAMAARGFENVDHGQRAEIKRLYASIPGLDQKRWEDRVGESIVVDATEPFARFSNLLCKYWRFRACAEDSDDAIAWIQGTRKAVATACETESNSWILVSPTIAIGPPNCPPELFTGALRQLHKDWRPSQEGEALPDWHVEYSLPGERELGVKLNELAAARLELATKIDETTCQLEELTELKLAFTGAHDSLVNTVATLLGPT